MNMDMDMNVKVLGTSLAAMVLPALMGSVTHFRQVRCDVAVKRHGGQYYRRESRTDSTPASAVAAAGEIETRLGPSGKEPFLLSRSATSCSAA